MNAKQQRVAEELAAAATDEKDELSQLPEDLQLRILECIDAPQDCAHLSLASPRLGLAALRANPALPPFWDPIFAIAMRFATSEVPPFEREYLLTQINRFGGNISRTAAFVGMERSALHRKLKSLGVVTGSKSGGRMAYVDEDHVQQAG